MELPHQRAPLSRESRVIAEIIGVLDLIAWIAVLEERGPDSATMMQRLAAEQALAGRIDLAVLQVEGAAAEVRCEKERADQLADRLETSLNRDVRAYTLAAILSGALFSFATGGLFLAGATTAGTAVGLAAGSIETTLGALALTARREQLFWHRRNVLGEIWTDRDRSPALPDIVWRYVNQPVKDDPLGRSLRETLIVRWREDGRLGEPGSDLERKRTALLFGEGGHYDIGDLRARAAMLNGLEADIHLMSQDMTMLLEERSARQVLRTRLPPDE